MFFIVSLIVRQANKRRVLGTRKDSKGQRSLMVITSSRLVDEVIKNLSDNSFHDYFISGIILMDQASADVKEMSGIPVLGRGENILFYIGRNWVDEVFLYRTTCPTRSRWSIPCSIWELLCITVSPPSMKTGGAPRRSKRSAITRC